MVSKKIHKNYMARELYRKEEVICGNISEYRGWIKLSKFCLELILSEIDNVNTRTELIFVLEKKFKLGIWNKLIDDLIYINYLSDTEVDFKIEKITFDITSKCNLNCKHCSGMFTKKSLGNLNKLLIFEIFKWAEYNNVKYVCISGGEPFIRKDIFEILNYAKNIYTGEIEVITNATLINSCDFDNIVNNIDILNISLDGYDVFSVNKIRGLGVYEKVLDVINKLKQKNFLKLKLSMVKAYGNENHISDFLKLCSFLQVEPVIRDLIYAGRANRNNLSELETLIHNSVLDESNINMRCVCKSGINSLYISHDGKIYPCSAMYNLKNSFMQLSELLSDNCKSRLFLEPIVDHIESCKYCDVRYFCCNTCPSVNLSLYKNEKIVKMICDKNKKTLENIIWNKPSI